jgi:hypothetical protein
MALPKIEHPIHTVELPLSKKKIRFRPFLVKEEKLFLFASQSGDAKDLYNTIKQVINNCALEPVDIDTLPLIDLEYFFIRLRAVSVNNIVNVTYKDNEDEKNYPFAIDLDKVEVEWKPGHTNIVKVSPEISVKMRYPVGSLDKVIEESGTDPTEAEFAVIRSCIEEIHYNGEVHKAQEAPVEELTAFMESLDNAAFEGIQKFFLTMPSIKYEVKYKNSLGNDRVITLTTLEDFFTLG